jgi:hypothetical protein
MLTVKNRREHRARHQNPRQSAAALYPQVQLSSGGASELHKRQRQDSFSLEEGQKKRRKTKASSANTTATSPVSLASDVGHVGTQGASEFRGKARAHSKKLFNSMVTRTKHVDNPPPWEEGTAEDFCNQKTFRYYRERGEPTMYVSLSLSLFHSLWQFFF